MKTILIIGALFLTGCGGGRAAHNTRVFETERFKRGYNARINDPCVREVN